MCKIFPSQFVFNKEEEAKYIEWVFEKTRKFVVITGVLVMLCIFCVTIIDIHMTGFAIVLSTVFADRIVMLGVCLVAIFVFLWSEAHFAQGVLFTSSIILALLATLDTYLWVGEVGYFSPPAQITTVFFFMILPFLNIEHKIVTGLLVICGIIFCGLLLDVELCWTLVYAVTVYAATIVVYYKFDVLLRIQYKMICEEKENVAIDQLTGVYNRNALHTRFIEDLEKVGKNDKIVVGILDIDCFKLYNDTYGHLAGDRVLRQFAQSLLSFNFDKVYRFGGEEFIFTWIVDNRDDIVLPDICDVLENHKIQHKTSTVSDFVTASIGIVSIDYSMIANNSINKKLVDQVIKCADDNMYKAKYDGRNQAVVTDCLVL